MKEQDMHRYIEMQDPEGRQAIKAKIDAKLPSAPAPAPVVPKKNPWQIFSWATACLCAICLAVTLPFLFSKSSTEPERFSADLSDYNSKIVSFTLKDYSQKHNIPLLYLDWYDMEEIEITTCEKTRKDGGKSFFFEESYLNGEIYDEVYISITDENTIVKSLELNLDIAHKTTVKGVTVYWLPNGTDISLAQFAYKGYNYYISLWDSPEWDTSLRIVEMLLQNEQ